MSDPNDKVGKPVTGLVTHYWASEGENDPHALYVKGYDEKFTTFDDETANPIQTGLKVTFRAEKNGQYWNIKEGTVAVVDSDPGPAREQRGENGDIRSSECVQDADAVPMNTVKDARIGSLSLFRSAALYHKDREDSTDADVIQTALNYAEAQEQVVRKLREPVIEEAA